MSVDAYAPYRINRGLNGIRLGKNAKASALPRYLLYMKWFVCDFEAGFGVVQESQNCLAKGDLESVALTHSDRQAGEIAE